VRLTAVYCLFWAVYRATLLGPFLRGPGSGRWLGYFGGAFGQDFGASLLRIFLDVLSAVILFGMADTIVSLLVGRRNDARTAADPSCLDSSIGFPELARFLVRFGAVMFVQAGLVDGTFLLPYLRAHQTIFANDSANLAAAANYHAALLRTVLPFVWAFLLFRGADSVVRVLGVPASGKP
jgi:hypothetical protein